MKYKTILIIMIVFLVVFFTVTATLIFRIPTSKYRITKSFKENKELFEKSIEELSTMEELYFNLDKDIINIHTYQNIEGTKNEMIKIQKEDFYKYEQTINLMKKLKIKKISKINENVKFLFSSSFYPGGKTISYIIDLEDYINMGNKIREKQQISENWYYTVLESL